MHMWCLCANNLKQTLSCISSARHVQPQGTYTHLTSLWPAMNGQLQIKWRPILMKYCVAVSGSFPNHFQQGALPTYAEEAFFLHEAYVCLWCVVLHCGSSLYPHFHHHSNHHNLVWSISNRRLLLGCPGSDSIFHCHSKASAHSIRYSTLSCVSSLNLLF